MNSTRLNELVGQYGLQCSETRELAPTTEQADALKWVAEMEQQLAAAQEQVEALTEENRLACLYAIKNAPQCFDVIHQDYPKQMDIAVGLCEQLAAARAEVEFLQESENGMLQTIDSLESSLAAAKEDTEIIDWIEKQQLSGEWINAAIHWDGRRFREVVREAMEESK